MDQHRGVLQLADVVHPQVCPPAAAAGVHHHGIGGGGALEPGGNGRRVSDRRRQADSLDRVGRQVRQALHQTHQVRAAVVCREGVHLVDDDRPDVAQQAFSRPRCRQEERLHRLRRDRQDIWRFGDDALARRVVDVAVPLRRPTTHEPRELRQPRLLVVQQRSDGRQVQDRDRRPVLVDAPREDRKEARLGLPAGGGREDDGVVSREDGVDRGVLHRPKGGPAQCVDDLDLQRGREIVEAAHSRSRSKSSRSGAMPAACRS